MLELMLERDRLRTLKFGRLLLNVFPTRPDGTFSMILHVLLFPTIFDAGSASLVQMDFGLEKIGSPFKIVSPSKTSSPFPDGRESGIQTPPAPGIEPNSITAAATTIDRKMDIVLEDYSITQVRKSVRTSRQAVIMIDIEMYNLPICFVKLVV